MRQKAMKYKTRVKLLTFFRTGKFGSLPVPCSKSWLDTYFTKVTDKTDMGRGLSIWRYGAIEFHFDGDNLFQIWCDNLDYLRSTRWVTYDRWIVTHPERLSFDYVTRRLEREHIVWSVRELAQYSQRVVQLSASRVELLFEYDRMAAFYLRYDEA